MWYYNASCIIIYYCSDTHKRTHKAVDSYGLDDATNSPSPAPSPTITVTTVSTTS